MREIKVRGKRVDNGEWVYGDLVKHYENQRRFIACDQLAFTYSECGIDRLVTERFYEVIPETVGQYTGLKDKNGVEIYEGDTCLLTNTYQGMNSKSTIEIAFEGYGFAGRWPEAESPTGYMYNPLRSYNFPVVLIEVIGNIHDQEARNE